MALILYCLPLIIGFGGLICLPSNGSTGALDVTEGIGAAFGIPHVPELWEEVSRTHSRSRTSSRARSRSRSAIAEVVSLGFLHNRVQTENPRKLSNTLSLKVIRTSFLLVGAPISMCMCCWFLYVIGERAKRARQYKFELMRYIYIYIYICMEVRVP